MAGRRPASWRFPTEKQARIEAMTRRLTEEQRKRAAEADEEAWWAAVLSDPRAQGDGER